MQLESSSASDREVWIKEWPWSKGEFWSHVIALLRGYILRSVFYCAVRNLKSSTTYIKFATRVSQLKIWHFWVIGIERNACRCTFNRYSVITQLQNSPLESSCVVVALIENYSTSKPLKVSPEKSQILSCDALVANERYLPQVLCKVRKPPTSPPHWSAWNVMGIRVCSEHRCFDGLSFDRRVEMVCKLTLEPRTGRRRPIYSHGLSVWHSE